MERRTFLVLSVAAVGLAGCTSDPSEPGPPSAPAASAAPSDPDARIREEVAASELTLIAAYRSAIGANPDLTADLEPFLIQHEAHLARVAPGFGADVGTPSASASPRESEATAGAPSDAPSGSPSDEGSSGASVQSVLAALADAESAAQAQRATACDGAQDPGLARDLCLIAASEAQHAVALDVLAATGSGS